MEISSLIVEMDRLGAIGASRLEPFFPRVRDRADIGVLRDPTTEVIVLSRADHVAVEYYEQKPEQAGHEAHGLLVHSPVLDDDVRRCAQFGSLLRNRRWVDFGCGLGGLLSQMKGQAAWMAGIEPSRARAAIATAKGLTVFRDLQEVPTQSLDVVSLFHVLEHLSSPLGALMEIRARLQPGGTLLIEVPHARDALFTLYDCEAFKRFTFWSEHLVLHTRQSLRLLLEAAGFEHVDVKSMQRYPVANHLRWLSHQEPGGHDAWSFLNTQGLHDQYEAALAAIDRTDTLLAFARAPKHGGP